MDGRILADMKKVAEKGTWKRLQRGRYIKKSVEDLIMPAQEQTSRTRWLVQNKDFVMTLKT